ncbi:hypothetical protein CK203_061842 [Vitis vinifera]|uniref:Uncharacterized protein n=2 Tax=Vitis vinifera TaxID=29760 RepID=A0A438GC48_VITVI|nr:hypothetical protein CK203_061842 [Vitis vinifera]
MESSSTQIAAEGVNITHMDAKFYNAAAHGHINILEQMSEDDIRFQLTPKENTILHIAARKRRPFWMVNALVCSAKALNEEMESGVDADKTMLRMMNLEKETAFHQAVRYHHPQVVKFLTEEDPEFTYGANVRGQTPLYMAVERGFGDLVDMIISSCTSAAHTGILGRTVLHAAIASDDQGRINIGFSFLDLDCFEKNVNGQGMNVMMFSGVMKW